MSYRPHLQGQALQQMKGLPESALDTLTRLIARVLDEPYERLFSKPLEEDPRERMAELGDFGFIEFIIDEDAQIIRIYRLVWTG